MIKLSLDNVKVAKKNFSGEKDQFGNEKRSFLIILDDPYLVDKMMDDGWNVRTLTPKEEGDEIIHLLQVTVKYNDEGRGPKVYLMAGTQRTLLDQDTIGLLDDIEFLQCDLDLNQYHCTVRGVEYVTAYLDAMLVTQRVDRFADRFNA